MRATRAYVAGFGTAGSLVAGAAILFVLASAVVSFHGWSQTTVPSSPATLAGGGSPGAPTSTALRLKATSAGAAAHSVGASAHPATTAGPQAASTPTQAQPTSSTPTGGIPGSGGCSPCGGSGHSPTQPGQLQTVVKSATAQLGNTVATTGQTLGKTIRTLTRTVASKLSGTLGQTVQTVGATLDGAVSAAGASAGELLSGDGGSPDPKASSYPPQGLGDEAHAHGLKLGVVLHGPMMSARHHD
jgi:hypothetical protein